MKKGTLLNSDLSRIIALLGHMDTIVVGDAGLPIPNHVERIDLSICKGCPSLELVLNTILTELQVETYTIAQEASPNFSKLCLSLFSKHGQFPQKNEMSHEAFKNLLHNSKAVIRTGECTPYYNIILASGVTF